jgi:hypothetical protein
MGEAAGVAMCISLAESVSPREIDVKALQRELIETGCNLGQAMREINGISEISISHDDKYPNPEYREKKKVVVQDKVSEFTRK